MPIPPKGYGKRGRPRKSDVKALLTAKGIIDQGIEGYYQSTHPNSSEKSTLMNSWRLLTPEVKEYIKDLMQQEALAKTTKDNLEKFYYLLIGMFLKGDKRVKASDVRGCLDSLKELVPEFKQRHEVEELSNKTEEEIDQELKKFGIDPTRLFTSRNEQSNNAQENSSASSTPPCN